jgi:hypothetical protein
MGQYLSSNKKYFHLIFYETFHLILGWLLHQTLMGGWGFASKRYMGGISNSKWYMGWFMQSVATNKH